MRFLGAALALLLVACAGGTPPPVALPAPAWEVYSPDPNHLWNRLHRALYERQDSAGASVGVSALDPLLWRDSTYLLDGVAHTQALALLDEFIASTGELAAAGPLARAVMQRDLWAVYDWAGAQEEPFAAERGALQGRLAQAIGLLALTEPEIANLPDNYQAALDNGLYPPVAATEGLGTPYLPAGLFDPDSEWVVLGRQGGPAAMSHTQEFPFFGRSVFVVLLRVPGGREATLAFIEALNGERVPPLPSGLEAALVRRLLVVDEAGLPRLSPLVESVQVRYFPGVAPQRYYSFALQRGALLAGVGGGLASVTEDVPLFFAHGDRLTAITAEDVTSALPQTCVACHQDDGMGVYGVRSLLAYSRARFELPGVARPVLLASTVEREAEAVMQWKISQASWLALAVALP